MKNHNQYVVGFVTAKDRLEARKISQGLLEEKLVACVNIVDSLESLFWWQGKIDEAKETMLIFKTQADRMDRIIQRVKSLHSYDTPEIIALPVVAGNQSYLDWISASVSA